MVSLNHSVPDRRVISAALVAAISLLLSLIGASMALGQARASEAAHRPAKDLPQEGSADTYEPIGQRALAGAAGDSRDGHSGRSDTAASGTAWRRHTIDDSSRGADGVRLKDVNGDGMPDLATGWEEGGIVRIYLNPGRSEVRRAWPAVTVGEVRSPEDAVLVDLDGDGSADVVSASEGAVRAIHLHHAPREPARYLDPGAWTTSAIPASQGRQWMFLLPMDVDGRNGTDLIVGSKGEGAMIGWLEAPSDSARTGEWRLHKLIDAGWMMSLIFLRGERSPRCRLVREPNEVTRVRTARQTRNAFHTVYRLPCESFTSYPCSP